MKYSLKLGLAAAMMFAVPGVLTALTGLTMSGAASAQVQSKKRIGEKSAEKKAADDAAAALAAENAPVKANGGVFKCVDRDGNITYGNAMTDVKGCKRIETEAVNTVPFPKPAATAARSPAPKSDGGAQRGRDTDRRKILQEELTAEEKKLAELKKEYNSGEPERQGGERNFARYQERTEKLKADVTRSESNIESLRREIGTIKD